MQILRKFLGEGGKSSLKEVFLTPPFACKDRPPLFKNFQKQIFIFLKAICKF